MHTNIVYDSKGIPFEYPTYYLNKTEYAKIISEINSNYEMYRNKRYPVHYSLGTDDRYYIYYFENHGFNDYNIVLKVEV